MRSAEEIRKELGIVLEAFHAIFGAGLGFDGDCLLHRLRQLRDDVPFTGWGDEVMAALEKHEREFDNE